MKEKQQDFMSEQICRYSKHLRDQERADQTIKKYLYILNALKIYLDGESITKSALIGWKERLTECYAPASVNAMLTVANCFMEFIGRADLRVRLLKIQKSLFCKESKELTREEYIRLVRTAEREGNERLSLILQTICATGIRVSELRFITVEAVESGRAEINNKGKHRIIFLPVKLCRLLKKYLKKQKRTVGAVFVTRSGKPLDRSNIWRDMKDLCENADVSPVKVFPHNLRHLFARTYYSIQKDLLRLADILGHSNINTTRIYTLESGFAHARHMEQMGLIIT